MSLYLKATDLLLRVQNHTAVNLSHYLFYNTIKNKGSPDSTAEHKLPELISVLGSQPTGDVSHKPGGRLPLLSTAVTPATLKRAATNFAA